ncbi:MAG: AtpZ/AtpI family protein [Rhodospirillales bacterium]|nr:AtpZ/AtpI family protein [Alphaproteobacteria bacterium]MBL6947274.1 AtpZ/AtpI family protein [Rhodospirillales bacterium]
MSDDSPEKPPERPSEPTMDMLDKRLREARGRAQESAPKKSDKNQPPGSALGLAMRVGVELVSALAIGVAIGWLLDRWLGTRPWLMLVFIFLGGAAGILNVYRMASGFGYAVGYQNDDTPGDGSRDDDTRNEG